MWTAVSVLIFLLAILTNLVWPVLIALALVGALNLTGTLIREAAQLVRGAAGVLGRKEPGIRESLGVLARLTLWMPGLIAGSILVGLAYAGLGVLILRLLR